MRLSDHFFDIIHASSEDILRNCRIKCFPDGSCDIMVSDRMIFQEAGWEAAESGDVDRLPPTPGNDVERAKRRARSNVYDLALCNDFRYFVTLTLDGDKIDRYDPAEVTRHLSYWLDNHVRRHGLKYVLVPELHKDGAIHFHGFFNDALSVVDSGTILPPGGGRPRRPRSPAQRAAWLELGGKVIYNLPRWGWGFSTAVELTGERRRAIAYVCKYITKGDHKIGGRWYYSGGDLRRPVVYLCNVDFDSFRQVEDAAVFPVPGISATIIKFTVEGWQEDE